MRILRTTLVVMLALLWAPLASHCLLESVLTLEVLSCCDHEAGAASHKNDCHDDSCATVEDGQYQSALQRLTVPLPALQLHFETLSLVEVVSEPASGLTREHPDAARIPRSSWQFLFRTSLPPRAPSSFV